jgi:DNA-binding response OmpR family regulator
VLYVAKLNVNLICVSQQQVHNLPGPPGTLSGDFCVSLDGLKILLVEDDLFIQMDLQMVLEDAGADVVTASNVAEGMAIVAEHFNVAVLDIRLPDGEVFPMVHALARKNTPLIFHSGNAETSNVRNLFPDAIALSKPVHNNILIDAVRPSAPAA